MQRIHLIALTVLMLSLPIPALAQSSTPAAEPATMDDYAGLVDIGGRSLYLECRGEGSPTVVLVSGYRASGRFWSDDLLQPDAPRTMVLTGSGARPPASVPTTVPEPSPASARTTSSAAATP